MKSVLIYHNFLDFCADNMGGFSFNAKIRVFYYIVFLLQVHSYLSRMVL